MLRVRQASVKDHDILTPIFKRQRRMLSDTYGDFNLAELIKAQDESKYCVVAEIDGEVVGFMNLCSEVNVALLNKSFDLGSVHGLRKEHSKDKTNTEAKVIESKEEKRARKKKEKEDWEEEQAWTEHVYGIAAPDPSTSSSSSDADEPESVTQEAAAQAQSGTEYYGESNAFSIEMFCIDEKYKTRSIDLLRKAFVKMTGKDFAIMTFSHRVPEFPLLQKFTRVTPQLSSTLSQELYIFNKMGLTENK